MSLSIDLVKKSLKLDEELKRRIMEIIADEKTKKLESLQFSLDGRNFMFEEVDETDWDDQGKYQYQTLTIQLIEVDTMFKEINKYNLFIDLDIQRNGSYFSEYYYDYLGRTVCSFSVETVPEEVVVIPEHEELRCKREEFDD